MLKNAFVEKRKREKFFLMLKIEVGNVGNLLIKSENFLEKFGAEIFVLKRYKLSIFFNISELINLNYFLFL